MSIIKSAREFGLLAGGRRKGNRSLFPSLLVTSLLCFTGLAFAEPPAESTTEPTTEESVESDSAQEGADEVSSSSGRSVEQCLNLHERGQLERSAGRLVEARSAFLQCSDESCPAVLRADCTDWFAETKLAVPSLVVTASRGDVDISLAELVIDGRSVSLALDGRQWELDPGEHIIEIRSEGGESFQKTVVLVPGQRARRVHFALKGPTDEPQGAAPEQEDPFTFRPVPASVFVFAGAAVVSFAVGLGFGAAGVRQNSSLEDQCAPYCDEQDKQRVDTKLRVADVSFAVAAALGVTAGILYLLRPERPGAAHSRGAKVRRSEMSLTFPRGGGVLTYAGQF